MFPVDVLDIWEALAVCKLGNDGLATGLGQLLFYENCGQLWEIAIDADMMLKQQNSFEKKQF